MSLVHVASRCPFVCPSVASAFTASGHDHGGLCKRSPPRPPDLADEQWLVSLADTAERGNARAAVAVIDGHTTAIRSGYDLARFLNESRKRVQSKHSSQDSQVVLDNTQSEQD